MENQLFLVGITQDEILDRIGKIVEEKLVSHLVPKPPQSSKPSTFGTRKEVSKELRISLPTLNDITKRGQLKAYRIGGRVLYKWEEVMRSLEEIRSLKYKRI